MPSQLSPYPYGNYSDPYSRYYFSNVGYYSAPPALAPALVRLYYDRVSTYGGSSAPVDCSSGPSYEQKAKGGKLGMGASLAVGAVVRAPSIGDACRPGRQRAKGRGRGSGRRRASGRVGIGADIFKRALSYPSKLIAKNAGINGDVVVEKVLSSNDVRYGYNAAKNCYEDLMAAGILDPTKVVRCCVEHAAAVAKTFLTSDVVVVDTKEAEPVSRRRLMPTSNLMRPSNLMPTSNFMQTSNLMPKSGIAL